MFNIFWEPYLGRASQYISFIWVLCWGLYWSRFGHLLDTVFASIV